MLKWNGLKQKWTIPRERPWALRFAVAALAVVIATTLRPVLDPVVGPGVYFILYYPTVMLCAWYGGLWPGIAATAASAALTWYFILPRAYSFQVTDPTAIGRLSVFVVAGTLISLLAESLHRTARKFERSRLREHEAHERLRVASRQKDEFLAMLAHELRNPLAPIRNSTDLLERKLGWRPEAQAPLAILRRQVDQLNHLVNDLLDVSRLAEGRIELKKRIVEIGAVLDQAVETVQPMVQQKSQHLDIHKPAAPAYVLGDFARLVQAFGNILHNATKYTDIGGKIDVTIEVSGPDLVISVRDTGTGIAPDVLPQVFDLFVQSPRTLDRSQGGLGIGLTVVKQLVQMHDGTVSAESAGPGRGSTFSVRLPIAPSTGVAAAADSAPASSASGPGRILVVDDNRDAADSLQLLLRADGHEAFAAYDAAGALEAVSRLQPEVVLLDIGLPDIDGYEVARRMRAQLAEECPRLIALTGYGQPGDRERAFSAGFEMHLTKPVDHQQLRSVLATDPEVEVAAKN